MFELKTTYDRDLQGLLLVQAGVVFVSAITLLPPFWRGCEARARGQIYLHLLEPAVKLSLKIGALDRLGNPHLYSQFLAKFLAKFLHRRKRHSPLSKSRKLTTTLGPTPWKLLRSPAVTKEELACLLQAKPKDLKRALNLDVHRV